MPNVPPSTEDQIGEHLPWEHLTIPPPPDRRFLMYGLAAGLIVAVLGVVIVRQLNRPSAADLQPVTQVAMIQDSVPAEPVTTTAGNAVARPTVTMGLAEPEAPTELSEADLMAVDTGSIQQKVAGRAEWLVLEFFTLDPSDPWRDRVETASGLRLPSALAPDTSGQSGYLVRGVDPYPVGGADRRGHLPGVRPDPPSRGAGRRDLPATSYGMGERTSSAGAGRERAGDVPSPRSRLLSGAASSPYRKMDWPGLRTRPESAGRPPDRSHRRAVSPVLRSTYSEAWRKGGQTEHQRYPAPVDGNWQLELSTYPRTLLSARVVTLEDGLYQRDDTRPVGVRSLGHRHEVSSHEHADNALNCEEFIRSGIVGGVGGHVTPRSTYLDPHAELEGVGVRGFPGCDRHGTSSENAGQLQLTNSNCVGPPLGYRHLVVDPRTAGGSPSTLPELDGSRPTCLACYREYHSAGWPRL